MNATIVIGRGGLEEELHKRVRGSARVAIVGIGDELQVHDRLGILAARELGGLHLPNVQVFIAGTVPEAVTGPIRRFRPDHIVLLDAADMAARPGTVAVISPDRVVGRTFSTHSLPLTVVIEYLETATKARVTLVGIQPDLGVRGPSPTAAEEAGLARAVGCMQRVLSSRSAARRERLAAASKAL